MGYQKQNNKSFVAMQSLGAFPIEFLLSTRRTQRGGCGADAFDRQTIYEDAVLRESADDGLAHAAGGWLYVLVASLAGIGYGWIYASTRSIAWAIVAHAGLNAIHFLVFTYP